MTSISLHVWNITYNRGVFFVAKNIQSELSGNMRWQETTDPCSIPLPMLCPSTGGKLTAIDGTAFVDRDAPASETSVLWVATPSQAFVLPPD